MSRSVSVSSLAPRPTLYVVDRAGMIRLRYMEPTYRTRPNLDAVLRDAAMLAL